MNDADDLLGMLCDAGKPGEAFAPTGLLAMVAGQPDPIQKLSKIDWSNELFEALRNDLGFAQWGGGASIQISPEERARWVALIRWLIGGFRNWKDCDDPLRRRLVAFFVVTQSCGCSDTFWGALPVGLGDNLELVEVLEKMVASATTEFTLLGIGREPIWEKEAVNRFKQADKDRDWAEIAKKWHLFEKSFFPNTLHAEVVRFLYHYGFQSLVRALDDLQQTPVAMQVAAVLSVEQRLRLANASDNLYVQFSCAYQTLSGQTKLGELFPTGQQLLTDLLLKVANDGGRWKAWMRMSRRCGVSFSPTMPIWLRRAVKMRTILISYWTELPHPLQRTRVEVDVKTKICPLRIQARVEVDRKIIQRPLAPQWRANAGSCFDRGTRPTASETQLFSSYKEKRVFSSCD